MAYTEIDWIEDFQKLADYVNGLRNHLSERIENLERENTALRSSVNALQTRADTAEVKLREAHNMLRTVSMQQVGVEEILLPTMYDFQHEVSQIVGEPVFRAPERFHNAPKLPTKS